MAKHKYHKWENKNLIQSPISKVNLDFIVLNISMANNILLKGGEPTFCHSLSPVGLVILKLAWILIIDLLSREKTNIHRWSDPILLLFVTLQGDKIKIAFCVMQKAYKFFSRVYHYIIIHDWL
jgi:hypothetical protein